MSEEERDLWLKLHNEGILLHDYKRLIELWGMRQSRAVAYEGDHEEVRIRQGYVRAADVLQRLPERVAEEVSETEEELERARHGRRRVWEREPGIPVWAGRWGGRGNRAGGDGGSSGD